MPRSARADFAEDIARARALLAHSRTATVPVLQDDLRRSAWMFAVGALDAYFCDAFADLLARTLNCKREEPAVRIPNNLEGLRVPVLAVITNVAGENWRWRLAARELIEDDNVLSFKKIKDLFNRFFPENRKVLCNEHLAKWIGHPKAKHRLLGLTGSTFRCLSGSPKNKAVEEAKKKLAERFECIFQRRHDCIHNCDRPKVAPQRRGIETDEKVAKVIEDVEFFVERMDETIAVEFKAFLKDLGFSALLRNKWTQNL